MKGETIAPGMKIVNLKRGHTAVAVEATHEAVGGDSFEIETVKTYMLLLQCVLASNVLICLTERS